MKGKNVGLKKFIDLNKVVLVICFLLALAILALGFTFLQINRGVEDAEDDQSEISSSPYDADNPSEYDLELEDQAYNLELAVQEYCQFSSSEEDSEDLNCPENLELLLPDYISEEDLYLLDQQRIKYYVSEDLQNFEITVELSTNDSNLMRLDGGNNDGQLELGTDLSLAN